MDILLIGGFLGGGKTTVLNRILQDMDKKGFTAAVIENEIGTVGIDDKTLSRTGVSITPLFGGCVCCQISGTFLAAVKEIRQKVNPDWILVELTGLALMDEMRMAFHNYGDPDVRIHTLAVADAARWTVLSRDCEMLIRSQLGDADVVLLNKTDVHPPTEAMLKEVQAFCPGITILPVAAVSAEPLWDKIQDAWKEVIR